MSKILEPWEVEPGRVEGDGYLLIRHPEMKHWCGYVSVPPRHPWHGKDYDDIGVDVHGGVTYAEDHAPMQEPDGNWWIGFDCAHFNDLSPGLAEKMPSLSDGTYRTVEYVTDQAQKLLRQAEDAREDRS